MAKLSTPKKQLKMEQKWKTMLPLSITPDEDDEVLAGSADSAQELHDADGLIAPTESQSCPEGGRPQSDQGKSPTSSPTFQ